MIKISEHPKKRFNITNKFNFYQKEINKGHNLKDSFNDFDKKYDSYINSVKNEILSLENKYNKLLENKESSIKLDNIVKEIDDKNKYLDDLESLKKKNLHNESVNIQNVKYSAKTIRLGFLYKIDNFFWRIAIVILIGIIVSVAVWLFVQYTGIYTPGFSGIIQGLAKIAKIKIEEYNQSLANIIYNAMFWCLYLLLNIPLIIFSYFKIGKRFAILSGIYISVSQLVGFCLGLINNGNPIFIFTNMSSLSSSSLYIPGVQMLPWNTSEGLVIGLFVYSLVYSIINGFVVSCVYILGSSSGGTDFIGFYYSKIKNKSIGNLLTIFNVISLVIGVILGSFVCWLIKSPTQENLELNPTNILEALFSPNLIASVLGTIISGLMYNYYFPRNKVIKVQIYSDKTSEIRQSLLATDWNYKLVISQSNQEVLNYLGENINNSLETICFYIDIPTLISTIRSIDNECLITIFATFGFDGELPTSSYEK